MNYSDECALACYEQIATINEPHGVYLVQHKQSKNIFIKKILTVYNSSVFQSLKKHHIKGTPEIFEVIEDDGKLIIIEEFISGNTLKSILDNGNCFSEGQALSIIKQLCGILREMHNSSPVIIHRDIKPSNIILTSDGDVKLIDMNAAKVHLANKTEDTALIGTVGYAAPEQYGFGASGVQADIYSIGILLNELLTGEPPKKHLAEGAIGLVIRKCTMMDPKDRYTSIDELLCDLDPQKSSRPTNPYKSARYMIPGFRSRNPTNMIIAVLGYGMILLLGLTLTVQTAQSPTHLWVERLFFVGCALLVVFFTCNYLNIWKSFRIDRIRNPLFQVLAVLLIDAGAVLLLLLIMAIVESSL